ncbi:hypothetical protein J6590_001160 [Homalodisca vitripennis]|nr:hypothetical protein J6590_001160 [Homalodisca vitripennis]
MSTTSTNWRCLGKLVNVTIRCLIVDNTECAKNLVNVTIQRNNPDPVDINRDDVKAIDLHNIHERLSRNPQPNNNTIGGSTVYGVLQAVVDVERCGQGLFKWQSPSLRRPVATLTMRSSLGQGGHSSVVLVLRTVDDLIHTHLDDKRISVEGSNDMNSGSRVDRPHRSTGCQRRVFIDRVRFKE